MNLNDTQAWMRSLTFNLAKEIADTTDLIVEFNERLWRTWGDCETRRNDSSFVPIIRYSIPFIRGNLENRLALRYLCVHEVCHLVEGGHGWKFERLCRIHGLDAEQGLVQNATHTNPVKGNWVAECPSCHRKSYRCSKPTCKLSCCKCDTKYNPAHHLNYHNRTTERNKLIQQITRQIEQKSESEITQIQQVV